MNLDLNQANRFHILHISHSYQSLYGMMGIYLSVPFLDVSIIMVYNKSIFKITVNLNEVKPQFKIINPHLYSSSFVVLLLKLINSGSIL